MDKAGREMAVDGLAAAAAASCASLTAASAAASPASVAQPPVLTRASMAAVYVGARGCFQVFGSGRSGPNLEFWGRMHGVHYQLQVRLMAVGFDKPEEVGLLIFE